MIPFNKRDGYIWIDGEFKEWSESNVHVLNHGLHYGSCLLSGSARASACARKARPSRGKGDNSNLTLPVSINFAFTSGNVPL